MKFRFAGHESVDLELGKIPAGWEMTELGIICSIVMGQSPSSQFYNERKEGLPFHQGVTDFGDYFPTDRVYCTVENRIAESGDILFSVRAPVGRINIANKRIVIGRGLAAIRSKVGNQTFILWQLKELFQKEDIIGNGSIFKAVTKEDVHKINILKPPSSIITQFEEVAHPILAAIKAMIDKNAALRRTRDLLLPQLISGEIDVSSWSEGDAEEVAQELAASVVGAPDEYGIRGRGERRVAEAGPVEPIEKSELEWRSLWES